MLKKQRAKPQPSIPASQWALQVYRRQTYLRGKEADAQARSSSAMVEISAPTPEDMGSSLRSNRSPSTAEDSDAAGGEKGRSMLAPLQQLTKAKSAEFSDDDEESFPRFSFSPTRKPSNGAADARGKNSPSFDGEEEKESSSALATSEAARRNFGSRRSQYYHTIEFSEDDEEEEEESSSEEVSDADDGVEQDEDRVEVFFQFQVHDELNRSDMVKALEAMGFICPQHNWINDAWRSVNPLFSAVDLDDFLAIVRAYEERQHLAFATSFAACDKNCSGVVECSELSDLLLSLNMEPMSHVLDEVISEVDVDGHGTLDLNEFKAIMQLILSREGFSKSEYEEFMLIFERYDRDKSGECDASEMAAILNWLGFAWSRDRMMAVLKEVDIDHSGSINKREFIVCMRKVREVELQHVKRAMQEADRDGDGTISSDEMPYLLKELGYDPWDVRVILEAQRRANLEDVEELDLGQVWQVLQLYRRYEGFSEEECNRIEDLFNSQEKDADGELSCIDMPKALRALGYKLTFEVVQSVLAKVDVDDTGSLSLVEFRKMIRMLQQREAQMFRTAFRDASKGSDITVAMAKEIGRQAGCKLERHHFVLSDAAADDEEELSMLVSMDGFTRACCNYAKEMREAFRKNGGFSDDEVSELRQVFDSYDSRKTGKIANKDLVRLVDNLCPSLAREKALRPHLQQMMQACQELNGSLGFKDFLKLLRLVLDFQDKERAQKELAAIKSTGFSQAEVLDFRELFLQADEGYGVLSFEAVRAMIHSITPLGDNLGFQLQSVFAFVTRKKVQSGIGSGEAVDFSEFLMLMKQLLDMNFARLKEKTSQVSG